MTQMHRRFSLFAGGFLALAAVSRLSLRLFNSHMLISDTFWYLLYLAIPQILHLAISAVMLRGRKGVLAGTALALNGLYVGLGGFGVIYMVNRTASLFSLPYASWFFSGVLGVFYLLAAVDCFGASRFRSKLLGWVLILMPVVRFLAILAVDARTYAIVLGDQLTFVSLCNVLVHGLPGLLTGLITELSVALALVLPQKIAKE